MTTAEETTPVNQAPDAPEAAPEPTPSPVKDDEALMQRGLKEMAEKGEDATDFIHEIRDQKAWREGDPKFHDPYRRQAREERWREIYQKMERETAAALQHDPDALESRIETERIKAKAQVRIEHYERENPGFMDWVQATVDTYGDLTPEAATIIHQSDYGPEIIALICEHPETIAQLNQLSARDLELTVAKVEGFLRAGTTQRPAPPPKPKVVSSAPKPVPTVSGTASAPPTRDLHELAKSEDATAFIQESRRRERAMRGSQHV
jgi:hypothetical protein